MIETGYLRIFARELIRRLTRKDIVQDSDIRWLKDNNGVFPRKHIWSGEVGTSTFKETPYVPDDTFVLFDVLTEKNIASEVIGDKVYSHLPFSIVINIYGKNAENESQVVLSRLHSYGIKLWMQSMNCTLTVEPSEFTVLDGRENASWWFRRRLELKLNTQQVVDYDSGLENGDQLENIDFDLKVIEGV